MYAKDSSGKDILDDDGERLPVLCGNEFPDLEDGPWSVWLDLCADCHTQHKENDSMSLAQSQYLTPPVPSKTIRRFDKLC